MFVLINDIALVVLAFLFSLWIQERGFRNGRDVGYDEGWDDAKADTFCYFDEEDSTLYTTDMQQFHKEQAAWLAKQLKNSPLQDGSEQ